jgi:hypothetical protein
MSKHTPGPIKHELDTEFGLYQLTSASGELVGKAVGQNEETDEANARLWAAAPEMYDALHVAAGALAALLGTENQAFKIVAAAISKADRK